MTTFRSPKLLAMSPVGQCVLALSEAKFNEVIQQLSKGPRAKDDKSFGICTLLYLVLSPYGADMPHTPNFVSLVAQDWKHYSGQIFYPIQHPHQPKASHAYADMPKWDRRTEYGRRRWELLERTVEALKQIRTFEHGR